MMFDSFGYWVFFASCLVLYWMLRDRPAKVLLVVASYIFYGFWDARFVLLLLGSTAANYAFGRLIDSADGSLRKRWVTLAVAFNLALLGFFKYCDFFIGSFAALFGIAPDGLLLHVILPVGISFFTFEGIAYSVDIYRRQLRAVRSPLDFAVFISFFPHLIAGPIIRPHDFFPQLLHRAEPVDEDRRWGLREILKGLVKKVALADFFALIANAYFNGTPFDGAHVPASAGVFAFAMQIYFDFSGYTDIARGCARLLGYRFPVNFARPYLSADIADFWRRWHVSLSTWLRDYLYFPLGGNRHGSARTYANLMIVMGLGGLWHGASWNFLLWGLYQGLLLCVHRAWRTLVTRAGLTGVVDHRSLLPFWTTLTFLAVTVGWVPFRAADFASTARTLRALAGPFDWSFWAAHRALYLVPLACLGFCIVDRRQRLQDWLVERASNVSVATTAVACLVALELFAPLGSGIPFLYFKF
ncbi:MBOAT family O-acyltransferase [Cognatiluteimonas profundi]|uniref:MBOAT family O-acyltransferase n=1 Tax=Cognatiluteimonas profundi TaxID=2594501 RepID=UPI00131C32F2|nr:MBOAT family O-acyltransferase [Lysobacter profundi]